MKVAILSEGKYGLRAYNNIKEKFPTDFLIVKYYGDVDIEIDKDIIKKLKDYDLFILYLNPNLSYEIVEKIKKLNPKAYVILGFWGGEGFKRQIEKFGNCIAPKLLCELDEEYLKNYIDKYPQLKEFLKYFGKPKIEVKLKDNKIVDYIVIRDSICGSAKEVIKEFLGKEFNKIDLGLRLQHFCVAGKCDIFKKEESKKAKAGKIFVENIETV
ncbi:DUF166 family protein [Methanocaldococcus indicus]|uniref:DUF166 family protein n=1 Tax=Methanocaldococcus indicus TaxID=213231 RepID=UPI003C6D3F9A